MPKFQGTTTNSNSAYNSDALRALVAPFPQGLDDHLRSPSDAPDDYLAAYERARAHTALLAGTRVAWLWRHALEIGFRAGSGGVAQSVRDREASEDFALGREAGLKEGRAGGLRDGKQDGRKAGKSQGLKEGEAIGFEKGKLEGESEGKRLGFVAGRDFGEKQAVKLSKTLASDRVLVDAGTDSPAVELSPSSPSPNIDHASTPIDTQSNAGIPPTPSSAPFNWADEDATIHLPDMKPLPNFPARDLSVLRSDSTSLTPFDTLRYRTHRTQKFIRAPRRSAMRTNSSPRHPACSATVSRSAAPSLPLRPLRVTSTSALDWDQDPRLTDLSRALRSLGWAR
ncbi:hypothetical protein DFH09DRAFT_1146803 [Mycena vulgaris]|nr:hypothetical protein DFH09DRAFT_1146803 [Mycena vulgaris]